MSSQDALNKILGNCIDDCGCKLWQGSTSEAGHPAVFGGTGRRKVWEAVYGPIPSGKLVTVDCGQPLCLEPDHLKLTTKSEAARISNARPAVKAKRAASSAKTNQAGMGKITMEIARQIRTDGRTGVEWAKELGCSAALISHVRCGRSWVEAGNPFAGLVR